MKQRFGILKVDFMWDSEWLGINNLSFTIHMKDSKKEEFISFLETQNPARGNKATVSYNLGGCEIALQNNHDEQYELSFGSARTAYFVYFGIHEKAELVKYLRHTYNKYLAENAEFEKRMAANNQSVPR